MKNPMLPSTCPVAPSVDLRSMLRRHVVRRCCEALDAAARRHEAASRDGAWDETKEKIRTAVRAAFGEMPFGETGAPVRARVVSTHDRPHYRLENVLFESLPGWEVNASVYLPVRGTPPWPAVVVPVGHSGKQFESYQIPAQVFARCGYAAVTFDPPSQSGEKRAGNDHFADGVRCYLTGHSSNRYFVIDALRCIDYLESRSDIDLSGGVGITGVSGGGVTGAFAALFDDRIAALGPACCMVPMRRHPVCDVYAGCPETLFFNRVGLGIDTLALLAAAAPAPMLLMAGEDDEVFHVDWTTALAAEVNTVYQSMGLGDRFRFFVDHSGHAYTVAMALEFVKCMNCWVLNEPDRDVPDVTADDCAMEPWETLRCHPDERVNMRGINACRAETLRAARRYVQPLKKLAAVVPGIEKLRCPHVDAVRPFRVWTHQHQELLIKIDDEIELPATFLYPDGCQEHRPAVLFFDDAGRWSLMAGGGPLAGAIRFLDREAEVKAALLSVDLRGWGDSAPAFTPYELASWGAPSRWLSYVSAALGDHVMAMRVRDAVCAFHYLRFRNEIDPARIVIGGRGLGAVVALHVAAFACDPISESVYLPAGVLCMDMLCSFQALCDAPDVAWPADAFLPNVLCHYDVPEMVGWLGLIPTLLLNPLDAARAPLTPEAANELYGAGEMETAVEIVPAASGPDARPILTGWLEKILEPPR